MNKQATFVNGSALQLAKREVLDTVTTSRFWLGLVCVIMVLTVAAPFDSGEEFTAPERFVYWAGIATTTYLAALATAVPLIAWLTGRGFGTWPATALAGLCSGVPAGVIVYLVNTQIAGNDNGGLDDLVRITGYCLVIALGVMVIRQLILGEAAPKASPGKLLDRVTPERRGPILTLQAQDHYVEVTTHRGRDLILIRLADAIQELGAVDGIQTHRSWWVARAAVQGQGRDGTQMILTLSDGRKVPVSRANEKPVRAWLAR